MKRYLTALELLFASASAVLLAAENTPHEASRVGLAPSSPSPHEVIEVAGVAEVEHGLRVVPGNPDAQDSVWEAAADIPFVSFSLRSPAGIQQDLSLMGALFEDTAVAIAGIEVGDPQTGHHDLDIGLIPAEIASFEFMPAGGGFGGSALTGLLNVDLAVPTGANVTLWGGDFGLFRSFGHWGSGGNTPGGVAIGGGYDYARSDGWRPNTDFETVSAAFSAEVPSAGGKTFFRFGFSDREFGAEDFYAPRPSEEKTDSQTVLIRHTFTGDDESRSELYALLKRHGDLYILDRFNPSLYIGEHVSVVSAVGAKVDFGPALLSAEWRDEGLSSTSLGDHDRTSGHVGVDLGRPGPQGALSVFGGMDVTDGVPEFTLAARGRTVLDEQRGIAASVSLAKTYRLPSMTELYYVSPSNIGDPNLEPEHAKQAAVTVEGVGITVSFFRRRAEDLIDWIRYVSTDPWQATNIGEVAMGGAGAAYSAKWRKGRLRVYAEFMDADAGTVTYESKYALRYVEKRYGVTGAVALGKGVRLEAKAEALMRNGWLDGVALMDAFMVWRQGKWELRAGGTNLLDERYEDVPGCEAPGRWLSAGMSYTW